MNNTEYAKHLKDLKEDNVNTCCVVLTDTEVQLARNDGSLESLIEAKVDQIRITLIDVLLN